MERFHEELDKLKKFVEEMGRYAETMLKDSVTALKNLDKELAEQVIERKDKLNEMDDFIEEDALRQISLYQPVAKDLRTLGAILKLNTYFFRIGRYGKDIARVTIEIGNLPHLAKLVDIPHQADIVCSMIDDVLEAFESGKLENPEEFVGLMTDRDDSVDAIYDSILREALVFAMEDVKHISRAMRYIMVSRMLERCGDHACKIAEKVYYMVTGKRQEIN
jgi:phosphate transport system protein